MIRAAGAMAAAVLLGTAAAPPPVHVTGPPPGHTGGFGEPTCVACHEGDPVNAFGGKVTILGLPAAWEAGVSYVLTVILEAEGTALAGFQVAARFTGGAGQGAPAGVLAPLDPRVTVTISDQGQRYAHHTQAGTRTADHAGSSWLLEWTAPAAGGEVAFHVAANSANGDNSPLMDLVYAAAFTVPPAGS